MRRWRPRLPGRVTFAVAAALFASAMIGVLLGAYLHEVRTAPVARVQAPPSTRVSTSVTTRVVTVPPRTRTVTEAPEQLAERDVTHDAYEPTTGSPETTTTSRAPTSSSPEPTPTTTTTTPPTSTPSATTSPRRTSPPPTSTSTEDCAGLLDCLLGGDHGDRNGHGPHPRHGGRGDPGGHQGGHGQSRPRS